MNWEHGHPDDNAVEAYSLGTLIEEHEAAFEEHLLLCEVCQQRVTEADNYVRALRTAVTRIEHAPPAPRPILPLRSLFPLPLAGLLAAGALAVVFLAPPSHPVTGTASVHLKASRGAAVDTPQSSTVPAYHQIRMSLDANALPVRDRYIVELVDSAGHVLWQTPPTLEGDTLQLTYPTGCEPGSYWVRVYDPARTLLREYGLEVR